LTISIDVVLVNRMHAGDPLSPLFSSSAKEHAIPVPLGDRIILDASVKDRRSRSWSDANPSITPSPRRRGRALRIAKLSESSMKRGLKTDPLMDLE
jgi:hypothetical protein